MAAVPSSGWIVRSALLAEAKHRRGVLLDAPGGWGKTTLAEQLAAHRSLPVVRVRLSSPTARHALLAECRRALRRAGFADLSSLVDDADPDASLDDLLPRLHALTVGIALLVDEAHHLDTDAAEWLRLLLADLPDSSTLVIAGRTLPRVLTRRPPAHTALFSAADLAFTVDEITALVGDPVTAQAVHQHTGGWATAVTMALRTDDPVHTLASPSAIDTVIDDALGDERAAVARLAHAPLLSAAVATELAGEGSLDVLMGSGLPLRRAGEWLVLADSLREPLGRSATIDPARCERAARHYDLATAIAYLGQYAPSARASHVQDRHWTELLDLGIEEIDALLTAIGHEGRRAHPRILLSAARAAEQRDHDRRTRWLAEAATAAAGDLAHEVEAEQIRDLLRSPQADDAVTAGSALLARLAPTNTVARARTLLSLGIAHAFRSTPEGLAEADRLLSESRALCAVVSERRWESDALNRLAVLVNHNSGREQLAAEQMAASLALLPTGSHDWAVGLTYYADILDYLGRTAEAEAAAREAWETGRRRGDALLTAFGAWSMAIVRCHAADLEGTRHWLAEVERHPGTWMATASGLEFLAFGCDLLANLGDEEGARSYRARLADRADEALASLLDVVDCRLEAMFGDPMATLELLDRLRGQPYATAATGWVRELFRALALQRLGRAREATEQISSTLDGLERSGSSDLPRRHESLLVQMLAPVWPGGPEETGAPHLDVALLGRFAVLAGPQVVTPAPGNPATLVKVLALRGVVGSEQLIDLLWPEADVATGRARLRNLLNRVRTQSGDLVRRDGDVLQLAEHVTTDVARFDHAARTALDAPAHERAGLARLAIGAYAGDLLPGDLYEEWAAGPRERLRRRYLSLVDLVAAAALADDDVDDALRLLDLGIAAEPLEEARYVTAARALRERGRRVAAREYAVRGVSALAEVGIEPGVELAALADDGRPLDASE